MRGELIERLRPAHLRAARRLGLVRVHLVDVERRLAVVLGEALLLRVSAQAYVGEEDIDALAAALERDGWPGR